jgi:hypothetical protein
MSKYLSIPIEEFKLEKFEADDKIVKLILKFMHDGVNLNKSSIELSVIEEAVENSLNNTPTGIPILAAFEDNGSDFMGHDDSEISIGCIPPQNNNISYKLDTQKNKTYVYIDGYIWTDYSKNAIEILENASNMSKACSIEIEVTEGYKDKKSGIYVIKEFSFMGITLLGDAHHPGMEGSNATLEYSSIIKDSYESKLGELNDILNTYFNKNPKISTENFSEDINVKKETKKEDKFMNKKEIVKALKYSLTAMDLYNVLNDALSQVTYIDNWCGESCQCPRYSMENFDDNYIYAEDNELCIDVELSYSMDGDNAVVDFNSAVRIKYVPTVWDEGTTDDVTTTDTTDDMTMEVEFAKKNKENNKKFTQKLFEGGVSKALTKKEKELKAEFKLELDSKISKAVSAKEVELSAKFAAIPEKKVEPKTIVEPVKVDNKSIEEKAEFDAKILEKDTLINEKEASIVDITSKFDKSELELAKSVKDFKAINLEIETLKAFKLEKETEAKEAIFAEYSEEVTEEEAKSVRDKITEFSLEEVETKLQLIFAKKNHKTIKNTLPKYNNIGLDKVNFSKKGEETKPAISNLDKLKNIASK